MHLWFSQNFASWISLIGAAVIVLLLYLQAIPQSVVAFVDRAFRSLANQPTILLCLIPAASFAVNLSIAEKNGVPRPRVQDEFSYLLAADTFSHGRLTNPTPPFWEHFETPQELMRPTYMSKYPPGQGLVLALGQITTGMPIVGVWLCTAAACGAIYWMLLGFVSRPWSLLGGIITVIHPLLIHWTQIYWGGSAAVLGGALLLGASTRYFSRPSKTAAGLLAVGLIILANSRPFEGLLLAVPLMLVLMCTKKIDSRLLLLSSIFIVPAGVMMGYYNHRITGHFLRMPFQEYTQQYDVYPKFWPLSKRAQPVYRNDSMRFIHAVYEHGDYDLLHTPSGFFKVSIHRLCALLFMHADPWILLLPLFTGFLGATTEKNRWVGYSVAIFVIGLLTENFFLSHYAAPLTPAVFLLIVIGLRNLSERGRFGKILCAGVVAGFVVGALISAASPVDADSNRTGQMELIEQFQALHLGAHLIFVRYTPDHLIHDEWVYNAGDIERSRVVWARYFGPSADSAVAEHFAPRNIWLLTVGKETFTLNAYRPSLQSDATLNARNPNKTDG